MKRILLIILTVVAIFLAIGFTFSSMTRGQAPNAATSVSQRPSFGFGGGGGAPDVAEVPPMPAVDMDTYAAEEAARSAAPNGADPQQAQERLVIENADLTIVVKDPEARMQEITALAEQLGGFVVSSNFYQNNYNGRELPQGSMVIRVPSERLDEALAKIKAGALDVPQENRYGQDVTSEYVDLQAQLKAKQAAEEQLLEIMDQATRAEDVLAIYLQVQNVQTEIEQLTARIKYLEESAALSAITVQLLAEESTQPLEIGPWKPSGAARDAIQDLIFFFQNFVDALIRFVLLTLPSLILVAIPLYLIYLGGRALYRRVRRSRDVVTEDKEIKG